MQDDKYRERLQAYDLTAEDGATPFRLWWVRFHFLERLVALGYNPMYIDTDVSFRVNPYPLFKVGPATNRSKRPSTRLPTLIS